jgi:tetratricopeptide (TPR) repeat protein
MNVRPDRWTKTQLSTAAAALMLAASGFAGSGDLSTAQRQFDAGDYRGAITILKAALTQSPRDGRLHYWLGRSFFELRDYSSATTYAELAVKSDPQISDYHLWLGRVYGREAERNRSFSLARRTKHEFEEAVRLNPSNIPARRDLAQFHLEAPWIIGGRVYEARKQIERIEALDPVDGHLARADYWLHENKPERAEAEYRHVLELRPQRVEPYYEVADFYADRQDAIQMEEAVEAAARVKPADSQVPYYRGVVRVMAGNRLSEAEQLLKSYLASAPRESNFSSYVSACVWLGRLYEWLGKHQEAAARYGAALQLDPARKSAREGLQRVGKKR